MVCHGCSIPSKPKCTHFQASVVHCRLIVGPLSSVFDMTTFVIMWYYFHNDNSSDDAATHFETAWFLESLMTQVSDAQRLAVAPLFCQLPKRCLWSYVQDQTGDCQLGTFLPPAQSRSSVVTALRQIAMTHGNGRVVSCNTTQGNCSRKLCCEHPAVDFVLVGPSHLLLIHVHVDDSIPLRQFANR